MIGNSSYQLAAEQEKHPEEKQQEETNTNTNSDIEGSGRLFVRNLPYTTSEKELQQLFNPFLYELPPLQNRVLMATM